MHSKYLLLFIFIQLLTFAQSPAINKLDKKGKKQGEWIVYLDNKWINVKDTSKAKFIAYDKYINGKSYCSLIGKFKMPSKHESSDIQKMLNGEHKWYDRKNRLNAVYNFNNGRIETIKHYRKNGELEFFYDFNITYNNDPLTFLLYWYYPVTGKSTLFMHTKGKKGYYGLYQWDKQDSLINYNKNMSK